MLLCCGFDPPSLQDKHSRQDVELSQKRGDLAAPKLRPGILDHAGTMIICALIRMTVLSKDICTWCGICRSYCYPARACRARIMSPTKLHAPSASGVWRSVGGEVCSRRLDGALGWCMHKKRGGHMRALQKANTENVWEFAKI